MAEEKSVVTDYCEKELGKRLRNVVQTQESGDTLHLEDILLLSFGNKINLGKNFG